MDLDGRGGHLAEVESRIISSRLSPEEEAAAAAKKAKEGEADAIDEDEAWILNRKKPLVMHSGCDPANSERVGKHACAHYGALASPQVRPGQFRASRLADEQDAGSHPGAPDGEIAILECP